MTSMSLARWVTLGALVLTMCGAFSRSANGQTQTTQSADQQIAGPAADQKNLLAKGDVTPFAMLTAVTPVATVSAVPAPPPPSSGFNWTGFYVGLNIGHGANDTKTP